MAMKPAQKQFRTGFSLWCLLQVMVSAVRRKEFISLYHQSCII